MSLTPKEKREIALQARKDQRRAAWRNKAALFRSDAHAAKLRGATLAAERLEAKSAMCEAKAGYV